MEFPSSVNGRIMKLRIQIQSGRYAISFSVYASTHQDKEETVMTFYKALRTTIVSTPNNKLMVIGDLNARVDRDFMILNVLGHCCLV